MTDDQLSKLEEAIDNYCYEARVQGMWIINSMRELVRELKRMRELLDIYHQKELIRNKFDSESG